MQQVQVRGVIQHDTHQTERKGDFLNPGGLG